MPVIKPTCVRDLKLRVNLADVVSRVVALRKAGGARLKGLCPFHNEKTPSFTINDDSTFSYTSDLLMRLAATGAEMHHTDRNTLRLVKRYHPGSEYA